MSMDFPKVGVTPGDIYTIGGKQWVALSGNRWRLVSAFNAAALVWLTTPSSANLRSALTDETGSGAAVFGTAPTIVGGSITALTALSLANAGTGAYNATLGHNGTLTANRSLTWNLNDADRTVSLAGNLTTAGGHALTLTTGATTNVTLPSSGTLATLSGVETLAGKTLTNVLLQMAREKGTVSATAATGTIAFNALTQGVLYYTTNASANFTLNVRGDGSNTLDSLMSTGEILTVVFLNTNGGTAYYCSAVQIDGNSVTPKWQGGTAPSAGNVSSIDSYSLSIIKTGSATFTVLASQVKFA